MNEFIVNNKLSRITTQNNNTILTGHQGRWSPTNRCPK